jgi:hypothetical protein
VNWQPPSDPRVHPAPPTRGERAWDAVLIAVLIVAFGIPLGICIIGLVKTWHGGTWTP